MVKKAYHAAFSTAQGGLTQALDVLMQISRALAILAIMSIAPDAHACMSFNSPSFAESLRSAEHVFVAQVVSTSFKENRQGSIRLVGSEGTAEIRVKQTLKGNPYSFKTVTYNPAFCGEVKILSSHYYLFTAKGTGTTIELQPDDRSFFDVTIAYNPNDKSRSLRSFLILPVIQALYRNTPLPKMFPPKDIQAQTIAVPPTES